MAMDFSGQYRIPATVEKVWQALNDPAVLQACIAGCKQLDKLSDSEFTAIVVARVGPISATFRGSVVLSDLNPPNGYTLTGQGQGGAAGFARMQAKIDLAADAGETLLKYTAQAEIGGKLASVGSRLVQTVARKNADDFFAAFALLLGGSGRQEVLAPVDSAPAMRPVAAVAAATVPSNSFFSLVPAWLVVFSCAVGFAFGYVVGHLS